MQDGPHERCKPVRALLRSDNVGDGCVLVTPPGRDTERKDAPGPGTRGPGRQGGQRGEGGGAIAKAGPAREGGAQGTKDRHDQGKHRGPGPPQPRRKPGTRGEHNNAAPGAAMPGSADPPARNTARGRAPYFRTMTTPPVGC